MRVVNERPSSARWGVLVACGHQVEEAVPVGVGGKEREEERGAALGGKVSWSSCCLAYQYGLDPVMLAPYRHMRWVSCCACGEPDRNRCLMCSIGGVPCVLVEVDLHLAEHPVAFEHVLAPVRKPGVGCNCLLYTSPSPRD